MEFKGESLSFKVLVNHTNKELAFKEIQSDVPFGDYEVSIPKIGTLRISAGLPGAFIIHLGFGLSLKEGQVWKYTDDEQLTDTLFLLEGITENL